MAPRLLMAHIVLAALFLSASALAAEGRSPIVLAFLYPLATNRSPEVATSVHLSLLYGRVGSVDALGLHGVVTMTGGNARGVQLTGIYAQTYGKASGVHLTGVVSYAMQDVSGIHLSGLANVAQGRLSGFEAAALANVAGEGMSGVQLSPVFNLADGGARGFQVAGIANVVGRAFDGWQVATGLNYVTDQMVGLQFGGANAALDMRGTQIGVVNFATRTRGFQMGALNFAEEQHGVPFGMVNIAGNGDVDWITYGSNLSAVNTGIGTSVRRFYSMLTAGLPDLQGDVSSTLILTWNYGYAIPTGRGTSIGIDMGYAHYIPEKVDDPNENDRLHFSLQARAMVERTFSRKAKGFAGGGVARIWDEYRLDAPAETEPLFFAGMALF
ncbi:MAG TPA: hypothetical protein VFR25_01840 [Candidatus Eisenbacteria bacterium]|nr:hypothetical protein [Candidatus Eisenbacteria bacterium]